MEAEKKNVEKSLKEATDKANTLEASLLNELNHFKDEYEKAKSRETKALADKKEALDRESDLVDAKDDIGAELKQLTDQVQ